MDFFQNYPIAIPFLAILLAEVLKAVIDVISRRKKIRFISSGGMPSGHSSFVGSLVVVVANREGIGSTAFAISAVIALVVMYDAMTVRRQVGLHAAILNRLNKNEDLEESVGHTFTEVLAGAFFGALAAFGLLNFPF